MRQGNVSVTIPSVLFQSGFVRHCSVSLSIVDHQPDYRYPIWEVPNSYFLVVRHESTETNPARARPFHKAFVDLAAGPFVASLHLYGDTMEPGSNDTRYTQNLFAQIPTGTANTGRPPPPETPTLQSQNSPPRADSHFEAPATLCGAVTKRRGRPTLLRYDASPIQFTTALVRNRVNHWLLWGSPLTGENFQLRDHDPSSVQGRGQRRGT